MPLVPLVSLAFAGGALLAQTPSPSPPPGSGGGGIGMLVGLVVISLAAVLPFAVRRLRARDRGR